jgi:hypothetical protein
MLVLVLVLLLQFATICCGRWQVELPASVHYVYVLAYIHIDISTYIDIPTYI